MIKNLFEKNDAPIQTNEEFWTWFQQNEKKFYKVVKDKGNLEEEFFDILSAKLDELKDGYYYLTGMMDDTTAELVFTADGAIKNIPFVEELVSNAPTIENWKFTALKSASDMSITMAGFNFSDKNLTFFYEEEEGLPDEINITVVHKDLTEANKDMITRGTYIFLDNYIGELNFATTIDNIQIVGPENAHPEQVPISKLSNFLKWREKEFIEKYEDTRHDTESDNYVLLEANLENGDPLIATINRDLLEWDGKASHPWILTVEISYTDVLDNGLPGPKTYESLDKFEDEIIKELKDFKGYLNIGRQTAQGVRDIFFACKDFRKPSKILHELIKKYANNYEINYEIYKDKYWQSFNRFRPI